MQSYRLFGNRLTGSCAIEAALAEAHVPYEFITVNTKAGETRTESFRKINPRQQVPVLQLPDGTTLTEGPAILAHLADAHQQAHLAPQPGSSARGLHDRWMAFFHANVYEGELRQLFPDRYADEATAAPAVKRAADRYVERHFAIFESELGNGPFFFGTVFSMLDIYVWMLAQWADMLWLKANCPKLSALSEAVSKRPLIAPIHAHHFG